MVGARLAALERGDFHGNQYGMCQLAHTTQDQAAAMRA